MHRHCRRVIGSVVTTVIAGGARAQRVDIIERYLAETSINERRLVVTAPVLLGPSIARSVAAGPSTVVVEAPGGCACCIGGVTFRVFLTRQLRSSTPSRLILELAASDHTERIIAMLGDEWFSKVLTIETIERLTSSA